MRTVRHVGTIVSTSCPPSQAMTASNSEEHQANYAFHLQGKKLAALRLQRLFIGLRAEMIRHTNMFSSAFEGDPSSVYTLPSQHIPAAYAPKPAIKE